MARQLRSKNKEGFTFFIVESDGCGIFDRRRTVLSANELTVAQIVEAKNLETGNLTVHRCDLPASDDDVVDLKAGTVFLFNEHCAYFDATWVNKKSCTRKKGSLKVETALLRDFCKYTPTANVCDKYTPGVVKPSNSSKAIEVIDRSYIVATTKMPSPSPSPSGARCTSVLLSLVRTWLAISFNAV